MNKISLKQSVLICIVSWAVFFGLKFFYPEIVLSEIAILILLLSIIGSSTLVCAKMSEQKDIMPFRGL